MVKVEETLGSKILWTTSVFDLVVEVRCTGFGSEFEGGVGKAIGDGMREI